MKRTAAILVFICILTACLPGVVGTEETFSVAEKVNSFRLTNNPEALVRMTEENKKWVEYITYSNIDYKEHQGYEYTEKQIEFMLQMDFDAFGLIPEKSYCFYPVITTRYAEQYAKSGSFYSLIDSDKIWIATCSAINSAKFYYDKDLNTASENDDVSYIKSWISTSVFDDASFAFLEQPEQIEAMVEQEINEEIIDCKIVVLMDFYEALLVPDKPDSMKTFHNNFSTILYLRGTENEYGIKLFSYDSLANDPANLEAFRVYTMSELIQSCIGYETFQEYTADMQDQKPTYDQELQSLMDAGLLQGNDNGADPLKPLSRIEATTALVRALGLENEQAPQSSLFSDLEEGSWGVRYANIAYEKGLTNGVGDGLFAPEESISADQFVALLLRSVQGQDFDWTQAVELLISRGVITQEDADTMDLFTRADMAKIIYEAREKGLIGA